MTREVEYHDPHWVVNGNMHNEIKRLYMEAHDAAMVLEARLQAIYGEALHGRNYQTVDYGQVFDLVTMTNMLLSLEGIEDHLTRGAARAIKQREGL